MSSRAQILQRIAAAEKHARQDLPTHEIRTSPAPHGTPPSSASETGNILKTRLEENGIALRQCPRADDIPASVSDLVAELSAEQCHVRIAPHPVFQKLNWKAISELHVNFGRWQPGDDVTLSHGALAIADSGSLVVASGGDNPTGLAFLPEVHIIALRARDVVATLEEGMALFSNWTQKERGCLPRAINIISGASRTADIGGQIVHGAHGPRTLGVVIYQHN